MQTLAGLCPYEDGYAVYQARMVLSAFDTTEYLNNCEDVTLNNVRIAGNDNENKQEIIALGEQPEILFYPNPINEYLHIEVKNAAITSVSIFNLLGENVYESKINIDNIRISTASFPNGLYNVFITTNNTQQQFKVAVVH
ncbi:MAG: hypothetical protein BroJett020_05400 [Bacteroidota bacterium]|nr:T9SS type A sorting domain-containing protein [Flavobacteriales bacterium]GIK69245.1 MAG: hypothetical protein BroJett020_05400 [Bacteroidota bacterium]